MKRILITGFKPFLTNKTNPSMTLVEKLKEEGYEIKVLDVSYAKADSFFSSLNKENYDFILSFGLASNRKAISIERYAYNEKNMKTPDSDNKIPLDKLIDEKSEPRLKTVLDVDELVSILNNTGIKAYASEDPGRYLCNYVFFKGLSLFNSHALFVHLPNPNEEYKEELFIKAADQIIAYIKAC